MLNTPLFGHKDLFIIVSINYSVRYGIPPIAFSRSILLDSVWNNAFKYSWFQMLLTRFDSAVMITFKVGTLSPAYIAGAPPHSKPSLPMLHYRCNIP